MLMSQDDFTTAVEEQLRIRGISFGRAELLEFVRDVWPLAEDDPDPVVWAERFIESGRGTATA
jgi:hypothetical protein